MIILLQNGADITKRGKGYYETRQYTGGHWAVTRTTIVEKSTLLNGKFSPKIIYVITKADQTA